MTDTSTSYKTTVRAGVLAPRFMTNWLTDTMTKFRVSRDVKTSRRHLSYHSDAQLADIGLQRSELTRERFEDAADAQAEAMLRVYR